VGWLSARALSGIPEVRAGDDVAALILRALGGDPPGEDEVVSIAHTIISKAEGAVVSLDQVSAGERALELGALQGRDPRVIQVVLDQSQEILRAQNGVLISRTHHGFVCANAGVDASNAAGPGTLVLLPRDPDASARRIRARLRGLSPSPPAAGGSGAGPGGEVPGHGGPAVMVTDTFGRAWRHGQTDIAIGLAGMAPLDDWRGRTDAEGLELRATWLAVADAAAGAADLAREKDSREPVVVIGGLQRFITDEDGPGALALLRPLDEDLFR